MSGDSSTPQQKIVLPYVGIIVNIGAPAKDVGCPAIRSRTSSSVSFLVLSSRTYHPFSLGWWLGILASSRRQRQGRCTWSEKCYKLANISMHRRPYCIPLHASHRTCKEMPLSHSVCSWKDCTYPRMLQELQVQGKWWVEEERRAIVLSSYSYDFLSIPNVQWANLFNCRSSTVDAPVRIRKHLKSCQTRWKTYTKSSALLNIPNTKHAVVVRIKKNPWAVHV